METNSLLFLRAVELAVIASYELVGKQDKNNLDKKAVDIINLLLTNHNAKAKIAIGEGELDEAPMLYQGQTFTNNHPITIDIAVDPIEGTAPASKNEEGSISCIAIAKNDSMLQIPEMYMEKLFIAKKDEGHIDFTKDIKWNLDNLLKIKKSLKVIILDKPRHQEIIQYMEANKIKVIRIKEGDVLGAIDVVLGRADLLYGIGGAPEGVLMASLAIATNHIMFNRLVPYQQIWPSEKETTERMKIEAKGMQLKKLNYDLILRENDLVKDDNTMFFAASLTGGALLKPLTVENNEFIVNSFIGYNNIYHQIVSKYPIVRDIKYLLTEYSFCK
ncbi:fructose-bisphosphatase class II [Spiroplasma eriocheiris]|uniref:fructose-bisphosphatase n=1 Tax=Spiroplasma eriocheiris TaxID=315358 RepID=A0A0H3XK81_9MOLU|nr:fructose-bisphosphatase class II [Spiroplasma eriocheiris]AHF57304.1 fructose 1,6-bisphosphatase II [Spiroplasma eriocheiris CCTCC M 207170]AKM53764.1 fructose 1,6-bisphosphatase II [Spiroplasma eriocheiris]